MLGIQLQKAGGSLSSRRIGKGSYEDSYSIVEDIHRLLGSKTFFTSHSNSAKTEIEDAIDAISRNIGEDLSWLKDMIGTSPVEYLITERKLSLEQRALFAGPIISELGDAQAYDANPQKVISRLIQRFDSAMTSSNPADASVAVRYAAIIGNAHKFEAALQRAAHLYEVAGQTIAAQFYRNHSGVIR